MTTYIISIQIRENKFPYFKIEAEIEFNSNLSKEALGNKILKKINTLDTKKENEK